MKHDSDNREPVGERTDILRPEALVREPVAPPLDVALALGDKFGGRFRILSTLGSGGMGTVYKAYEPALKRHVAIKVLRGANPDDQRRFQQEAQAQARLDHENICRVFDVGEVEGRPYIVMQYIDGKPLRQYQDELSREQKVRLIEQIAGALHEAHERGLVHRDVKPGNIILERVGISGWKPYILDFGLVQDQDSAGLTQTGMIMGTPKYMAPEQAAGHVHEIDRRADIYSLGVVLYELLCGQAPFEAFTEVEMILRVIQAEPRPLRRLAPTIPVDLETVVMKALERDRTRRYPTALALAEDLRRFRQGEAILAHPPSLSYRLSKQVAKHKAVFALSTALALVVVVGTTLGLRAWWRATARAELAQRFGREVETMQSFMRYAHTLPLHDIRREEAVVRDRMKRIEDQMMELGSTAVGPGDYALGRGYLALQDYEKAHLYLNRAWENGFQTAEAAYTLGQNTTERYQKALEEAQRIENKELRERQKAILARDFRDPALRFLRRSGGVTGDSPAYVEGLIALCDGDYVLALSKARKAHVEAPWLPDALKLEGDIHRICGGTLQEKGDFPAALNHYRLAGESYRQASAIARSDADIYESDARRRQSSMEILTFQGKTPHEEARQALAAVVEALTVSPDRASARLLQAKIYLQLANAQFRQGEDSLPTFQQAAASARAAIALDPRMAEAYRVAGSIFLFQAMFLDLKQGRDPWPNLGPAAANLRKALEIDPTIVQAWSNLGSVYGAQAEYANSLGQDPRPFLDQAALHYEKALGIAPANSPLLNNLANIQFRKGEYEAAHGQDPRGAFERSIAFSRRAMAANPSIAQFLNVAGAAYENLGLWVLDRGGDPRAFFDQAMQAYRGALEKNPKYSLAMNNLGNTCLLRARYERDEGGDPGPWLDQAEAWVGKAIAAAPGMMDEPYNHLSEVFRLRAGLTLDRRGDPEPELRRAREAAGEALRVNAVGVLARVNQARIGLLAAEAALRRRRSPETAFGVAEQALREARAVNPAHLQVLLSQAELSLSQAEWLLRQGKSPAAVLAPGQAATEKALAANPRLPQALALQGALKTLGARTLPPGQQTEADAVAGRQELSAALAANSRLKREFLRFLE